MLNAYIEGLVEAKTSREIEEIVWNISAQDEAQELTSEERKALTTVARRLGHLLRKLENVQKICEL